MNITEQEINKAYKDLKSAVDNYSYAASTAIAQKNFCDMRVAKAMASGEIEGKNAEIRQANAREMFETDFEAVEETADGERSAKLDYDLALLEVQRVRALLRLAEVQAGVQHVA